MRVLKGALLVAAFGGLAWAAERFTSEQLGARFYADLGPSTIDVSAYPAERQQAYESFQRYCSGCHTPARAVNSQLTERKDWSRYVTRMHIRNKGKTGAGFYKAEAKAIVDFLAYDSNIRKVERKAEFDAQTAKLKALFEEVKTEALRAREADNQKKAKGRDQTSLPGQ